MIDINFTFTENVKALFLLYLAISSNFLSNTMNCSIHKKLINNMPLKHLFILCIIYFTIDFASKENYSSLEILKRTIYIYILYIVLSKQQYNFFILNFIIIFIIYVISIQKSHENKQNNTHNINKYNNIIKILQIILIITLIIGFLLYFNKQFTDHRQNFNIFKFMFGTIQCNKLHM
jgi:hypothetical protein